MSFEEPPSPLYVARNALSTWMLLSRTTEFLRDQPRIVSALSKQFAGMVNIISFGCDAVSGISNPWTESNLCVSYHGQPSPSFLKASCLKGSTTKFMPEVTWKLATLHQGIFHPIFLQPRDKIVPLSC